MRSNYLVFIKEIERADSDSVIDQSLRLCLGFTALAMTEVTIANRLLLAKSGEIPLDGVFDLRGKLDYLTKNDWVIFLQILLLLNIQKVNIAQCDTTLEKMCWEGMSKAIQQAHIKELVMSAQIEIPMNYLTTIHLLLRENTNYPLAESTLLKSCARFFVRRPYLLEPILQKLPEDIQAVIFDQNALVCKQELKNLTFSGQHILGRYGKY